MKFSPQQKEAMRVVSDWADRWHDGGPQVCRVFGYAGTGKTSIAQAFAKLVPGHVEFACYTGKAAHVLREKGCVGAGTLHSLIYIPKSKSAERLRAMQREYIEIESATPSHVEELAALKASIISEQDNVKRPSFALKEDSDLKAASMLIIDEVSMVNEQMGEDLESFGVPILVLGDPAQLPPTHGGGYFTNATPDVLLTEVHRQAADSPILRLATDIREGAGFANSSGLVLPKGQPVGFMAEFDQILCGTNRTRQIVNRKVREFMGMTSELPMEGDRIICTRNDGETGLLNGSQWRVLHADWDPNDEELSMSIQSVDSDTVMQVTAHHQYFQGSEPAYYEVRGKQCFDFAYCMTVHKSQGSQFDRVCLIDEAAKFNSKDRRAWRYTGVTRAAKELVVIR